LIDKWLINFEYKGDCKMINLEKLTKEYKKVFEANALIEFECYDIDYEGNYSIDLFLVDRHSFSFEFHKSDSLEMFDLLLKLKDEFDFSYYLDGTIQNLRDILL